MDSISLNAQTLQSLKVPRVPSMVEVLFEDGPIRCPCCEEVFDSSSSQQDVLRHLFLDHKLVIADVERIASLRDYLEFWSQKFCGCSLAEYCTTMMVDTKINGEALKNQEYFLLSDVVPIDNQLRRDLQKNRLDKILEQQKLERNDKNFERECLICRTVLKGTRTDFLEHLFEKHNFYIAKLDNLIFTGDLIEYLNDKLTNNVCVYCEKVFKDRVILKEHMRKKGHKRINPKNEEYDKYFISNYLEMGKNWQSYLKNAEVANQRRANDGRKKIKDDENDSSSEDDGNWSDWDEKDSPTIVCLFCKHTQDRYTDILSHMSKEHSFNFDSITKNLNFYEKFKIVNYIRRQMFLHRCIDYNEEFKGTESCLGHMYEKKHLTVSNSSSWNQPEFYFPTYEDDGLLYYLEDNEETDEVENINAAKSSRSPSDDVTHISEKVALSVIGQ